MRIFLTGSTGRLGGRLHDVLRAQGHDVTAPPETELDITDFAGLRARIIDARPDVVINPAAWTDVDACAREPERAILINGLGAQNVALSAAAANAAVLFVSSNEVFDGRLNRPYTEYDVTGPVNAYGFSKLTGETATIRATPRHYVVRTAWLFAHGGKNFIQSILGAAAAGKPLRVVTNEVANPTYNDDLADAITRLVTTERFGTYHFVNQGATSRDQFARYVLDRAGRTNAVITPISSHEWQRASTPPVYTPLSNLAGASIGITLRPWQEAVDAFLSREGLLSP